MVVVRVRGLRCYGWVIPALEGPGAGVESLELE